MHILLLTQLFQPEPNFLKGILFAKRLVNEGHTVEVLTGFPNYPEGKVYPGYKQRLFFKEVIDGIPIKRVPLFPDHSQSGIKRIFSYISFALSASLIGPFLIKRPDLIHIYLGPSTLIIPGLFLRFLFKSPIIQDIQDIWPESVTGSGMLRWRIGEKAIHWFCKIGYKFSNGFIVLSKGYKELLIQRGVQGNKISVVYNWAQEKDGVNYSESFFNLFDGVSSKESVFKDFNLQVGKTYVVYAGNHGILQNLKVVIDAAKIVASKCSNVDLLFFGDGVEKEDLIRHCIENNIDNVRFYPRVSQQQLVQIYSLASLLLVHLKDSPLCRVGIPQKTQAYLSMGKPLLVAVNGVAAELIEEADAGIIAKAEDPVSIAEGILRFLKLSPEDQKQLGENGYRLYQQKMSFNVGMNKILEIFDEFASK